MQRIKLDINPKGEIPVLYASQCDKGRLFEVELVEGDQAYNVPLEYSVQLNVRKTDSKLVTAAPINIVDNIITFSTTEQMTACSGENIASITLKDADDYVITTLYFLISIQRDVLAGGLDSASEIHNIEQQIAAIVPEVIGDDYYNKSETDALLADKANISDIPDMSNYYTKAQTYSSSQIDTALSYKADASVLTDYALKDWVELNFVDAAYLGTHYYNKNAVDNLLFNMLPVGSASGNPCNFDTEIAGELVSLTADIICGGGGGTPSTPIPLVGHSELNLTRCGVNLFDEDLLLNATGWSKSGDYYVGSVGQLYTVFGVTGAFWHSDNGVESLRVSYTAYVDQANVNARAEFYYSDGTSSLAGVINGSTPTEYTAVSTSGKTVIAIKWNFSNDATLHIKNFSINYPSSATAYSPYNGQTFTVAFGQTVYGGVLDKSGSLKPCVYYPSYNGETLSGRWKSSEATYSEGTTPPIGSEVVSLDDFGTPFDVPSISVFAENGTNNIVSDCGGDVNVSYKDTIQHYIDSRI